jgi:hypothetical protein
VDRVAEHAEHEMIDIDLGEVTFMDARGLGLLVGMLTRQERHGGQLRLRRTPAQVTGLLQLTGLQGVFPVADGLFDAAIPHPFPGRRCSARTGRGSSRAASAVHPRRKEALGGIGPFRPPPNGLTTNPLWTEPFET